MLLFTCFLVACGAPQTVHAKPSAPVEIEYSAPKTARAGDEVTTVIRLTATTDLQKLTVTVSPYSGLELVSGGDHVEFTDLQSGGTREIEVNIRLTDELGYLSVFATTTDSRGNTRSKSIALRYGTADEVTIQKMTPRGMVEESTGERLILMPGEAR
jgi:hypothetical protein